MTPEALGRTGAPAWLAVASCLLSCAGVAALPPAHASPRALYASYCSTCHGADRMGGLGPPLLPGDLVDLPRDQAAHVIANGLARSHMPGFSNELSAQQIRALVRFIYAPPAAEARGRRQAALAADRIDGRGEPWIR